MPVSAVVFLNYLLSVFGIELRKKRKNSEKILVKMTNASVSKLFYFQRMLQKIHALDGDVVECGVGRARSFQMLAILLQKENSGNLWGFDSFRGFPEPSEEDKSPRNPQKGEKNVLRVNEVCEALAAAGVSEDFIKNRVQIVEGFFEDTLPVAKIDKIAMLHLDVDLYKSYKTCLKYLLPKVAAGGVVLFDEYGEELKFPGAKKAIDEYFAGSPYKIEMDFPTGKYYLVKN